MSATERRLITDEMTQAAHLRWMLEADHFMADWAIIVSNDLRDLGYAQQIVAARAKQIAEMAGYLVNAEAIASELLVSSVNQILAVRPAPEKPEKRYLMRFGRRG